MLTNVTTTLSTAGLEITHPDAAAARRPGWEPDEAVSWFAALVALLLDVGRGCQAVPAAATGLPALTEPAPGEAPGLKTTTPLGEALGLPAITGGLRGTSAGQVVEPGAIPPGAALPAGPSPPVGWPVAGMADPVARESSHPALEDSREPAAGEQLRGSSALLLASGARIVPAKDAAVISESSERERTPPEPLVPPALGGAEVAYAERIGGDQVGRSSHPAAESARGDRANEAAPERPAPPTAELSAPYGRESTRPDGAAEVKAASGRSMAPTAELSAPYGRESTRPDGATEIEATSERPTPPSADPIAPYAQSATTVSSTGEPITSEPRPPGNSLPPGPEVPAGEAWAALRARITELDPQRQSIRVAMDPEGLGAMQLEVSLTGDGARASFEVADPAAGQFLANREADLRQALEGVGVRLNSLNVRLGDSSGRQEGRTPGPDDPVPGAPEVLPPTRRLTQEAGTRSRQTLVDYRV